MGFNIKKVGGTVAGGLIGGVGGAAVGGGLADKASHGLSAGGINPLGKAGGSLGSWDVLGNALDKANPYVKKANKHVDTAGPMPGSGAPGAAGGLTYKSLLDQSGNLPDNLKVNAQTVSAQNIAAPTPFNAETTNVAGPNQDALNALKSRAMSQGDSPWAALQKQQNELSRVNQMDQASQAAMGQAAGARSALAMHGGLESGASERLAESTARGVNANQAAINRSAQSNALGIGISDDQTKMGLLSQIPGMDLANANFNLGQAQFNAGAKNQAGMFNTGLSYDASKTNAANALSAGEFNANAGNQASQFNVGNTIAGLNGQNQFNMQKYGIDMGNWAAGKQADAMANSGKK